MLYENKIDLLVISLLDKHSIIRGDYMILSDDIFDNLSFATQEKTKQIHNLKVKISNLAPWYYFFAFAFAMSMIVCLNIVFSYFDSFPYANISQLGTTCLIITFILFACFYTYQIRLNELKTSYEKLRIDIMKSIGNEFCTHTHSCACREDYIQQMHEKGIDLIFH